MTDIFSVTMSYAVGMTYFFYDNILCCRYDRYFFCAVGMTDIARQTVEFLYEENGGIPRDLHLPTIENIKEDLAKFTIERVRKGTTVVIRNTAETSTAGTTVLPKFAVRSMLKTFGLTGNVLDVDNVSFM
jgi:E3 ubiquitin-protein ligase HECTD4